jgi:hypothetical protein
MYSPNLQLMQVMKVMQWISHTALCYLPVKHPICHKLFLGEVTAKTTRSMEKVGTTRASIEPIQQPIPLEVKLLFLAKTCFLLRNFLA